MTVNPCTRQFHIIWISLLRAPPNVNDPNSKRTGLDISNKNTVGNELPHNLEAVINENDAYPTIRDLRLLSLVRDV